MRHRMQTMLHWLLSWTPLWLLAAIWLTFVLLSPQFRRLDTLHQVLVFSSSTGILAVGMTFVLLTAGIDLSVGAVMLVGAAVAGKIMLGNGSMVTAVAAMLLIGACWGAINGLLITRWKMIPFVVTLAMLFIGRGAGLWITETRAMNLPDRFRVLATGSLWMIPVPVWILAISLLAAHVLLAHTPLGRQVYAIGVSAEAARKEGVPVARNQLLMYMLCSLYAAIGGTITLAQINTVSPTFGEGRELTAIAAAVLGGVSLFGGRGGVAGAALGAVLIQTIDTGLSTVDADPHLRIDIDEYYYPLITGGILFLSVLTDSLRKGWTDGSQRRLIRPLDRRKATVKTVP